MPDSQPVQSASHGMSKSFVPRRVSSRVRNTSIYLKDFVCWLDVQVISLVKSVYLRVWAKRRPIPITFPAKKFGIFGKYNLGSMVSHQRVIVGLSQSAPAVGWGSPLHAWLASVNWIGSARYLNRGYRCGARGMHYHILLRQYSQNYYTYDSVVKNTYSPCHKDACVHILIENTEWLLRYTGIS